MSTLTVTLGTIGALISLVCWYYFVQGSLLMVKVVRLGQPDATRNGPFVPRMRTLINDHGGALAQAVEADFGVRSQQLTELADLFVLRSLMSHTSIN